MNSNRYAEVNLRHVEYHCRDKEIQVFQGISLDNNSQGKTKKRKLEKFANY
jgi:hypothetical protein